MRPTVVLIAVMVLVWAAPCARADTAVLTTLAGSTAGGAPMDGAGVAARLSAHNLAVDTDGYVYFAEPRLRSVRRMSPTGVVTTYAGGSNATDVTPKAVDGTLATATFQNPTFVAFGGAGNLFVYDWGAIRVISRDGNVSTLPLNWSGASSNNGAATGFILVSGMAADRSGNIYVIDGSALRKSDPKGVVTTLVDTSTGVYGSFAEPFRAAAIAVDTAQNLLIADASGATIRRMAADGSVSIVAGQLRNAAVRDGVGSNATFLSPAAITAIASGEIWVIDGAYGGFVRRISPNGTVTTLAGMAGISPAPVDGSGGNARVEIACALAAGPNDEIYLADGNSITDGAVTIRRVVASGQPASPILTEEPPLRNQRLGAGTSLTFSAAALGDTPLQFQWLHDGNAVYGATDDTLTVVASSLTAGEYRVRVTNAAGSVTSDPASLAVFTPPFRGFTLRHTVPGGAVLHAVTFGGGQWVVVGDHGTILASADGSTWIERAVPTTVALRGIAYGQGRFVAVGDGGIVLVSSDGVSWSVVTSGTQRTLNAVAFATKWVAVGEAGTIVTAVTPDTWTSESSGASASLRAVTYIPFVPFIGSGDTGTGRFYIGGEGGVLLSSTTSGWHREYTGSGTADIEALADGPTALGLDGTMLTLVLGTVVANPPGAVQPIYYYNFAASKAGSTNFRAAAAVDGAVFAVGDGGVVAAFEMPGSTPESFVSTGTSADLYGAAARGNTLFVVGADETILQSNPAPESSLLNGATRSVVGPGQTLTAGFVVAGTAPRQMLIRGVGPTLAQFGITNPLARPVLRVFDGAGNLIAANESWSAAQNADAIRAASAQSGAFALPPASTDAAALLTLPPGPYTAVVASADNSRGIALAEVYDVEASQTATSRIVNISGRAQYGTGENGIVAGFVIGGMSARRVLIRAIGPSLARFGVPNPLPIARPVLYDRNSLPVAVSTQNAATSESSALAEAELMAGAFPNSAEPHESGLVITLAPGPYTVQLQAGDTDSGTAMVEIYDLP